MDITSMTTTDLLLYVAAARTSPLELELAERLGEAMREISVLVAEAAERADG